MKLDIQKRVKPRGAVDVSMCRNGELFVSGWLFWSEEKPREKSIAIRSQAAAPDAADRILPLEAFPRPRAEVNEYLGVDKALSLGFSGRTPMTSLSIEELPVGQADILAIDPDGEFEPMKIGEVFVTWPEAPFRVESKHGEAMLMQAQSQPKSNSANRQSTAATALKPQGFFDRLWNGTKAYDERMRSVLDTDTDEEISARRMSEILTEAPAVPAPNVAELLPAVDQLAYRIKEASDNDGLIVVFDHDYGGGANTYSKRIIDQHTQSGNGVMRLWYSVSDGQYHGEYIVKAGTDGFLVDNGNELFRFLARVPSFAIQINSVWTYPELRRFLDNVLRLRLYGITRRLEFFAHDHMGVCPSLFLLNHKGRFCGVPEDLETCRTCLRRNYQDFKAYYPTTDIQSWRTSWQSLLKNADLIRFFSDSTLRNYCDAYPWLSENPNVVVRGHAVQDVWPRRYSREKALASKDRGEGLKIGVFGFISEHKGSHELKKLSDAIVKKGDDTELLVFGSFEEQMQGKLGAIKIMGPYDLAKLVDICEDNGLDVAFVPSICPETFSFTTKELSLIGIPVVSFDLGGQSDIVKDYEKGHIFSMGTGVGLLGQFKELEKKL